MAAHEPVFECATIGVAIEVLDCARTMEKLIVDTVVRFAGDIAVPPGIVSDSEIEWQNSIVDLNFHRHYRIL